MSLMDIRSKELSVIKDPFKMACLESVSIRAYKSLFGGSWTYVGTVEFENGNTKSEQDFEGKSLADVAQKVDNFLNAIERET